MDYPIIPDVVTQAIIQKFWPDLGQVQEVLDNLKYDNIMQCWYFYHAGMYHGIEPDGYIHT